MFPQDPPSPGAEAPRRDLLGLSRDELAERLEPYVDRPFRVRQIWDAIYGRGEPSFHAMTDLSLELRARLAERFTVGVPPVERLEESADGTAKFLFRLADGATVEAVDIPERRRRTLCLSCQAGCALACSFCVTGFWGAGRDLTAGEIVGQVLAVRRERPGSGRGLNLVFMGMGEPMHNLDAIAAALAILTESISWRRITISTAGVVPGIEAMASWPRRPNLAVSLHAPDDERRSALMPINRSYPLATLLAALARYPLETGRRITFEYLLIRDFNDAPEDADALARLLSGLRSKVNLIPVNPDPVLGARMVPPSEAVTAAFRERLTARGLFASVRKRRGDDVAAACGQLRAPGRDPRGFRRSNLRF